jgi:hypothetical protein
MPTYYNGKEIKESSIISGRILTGRGTINIGGRTITPTPTAPPPPQLVPVRLVDGGRIQDPMVACSIGLGGTPLDLYCINAQPGVGDFIFNDSGGSSPFNGGNAWYYDQQSNSVYLIDTVGEILNTFRCGR